MATEVIIINVEGDKKINVKTGNKNTILNQGETTRELLYEDKEVIITENGDDSD